MDQASPEASKKQQGAAECDMATSAGVPGRMPPATSPQGAEKARGGNGQDAPGTPPVPEKAGDKGTLEAAGKSHHTGQASPYSVALV